MNYLLWDQLYKKIFLGALNNNIRFYLTLLLTVNSFFNFAYSQLKIGSKAPRINITNLSSKEQEVLNIGKKFIVLEFWATWCAPCLAALPHMNELQSRLKSNKNLLFLSITNESTKQIKKILPRFHFESTILGDTTGMTIKSYQVNYIPATFLIDDKGIVRWIGNPQDLTMNIVDDFLKGKIPTSNEIIINENNSFMDSLSMNYRSIYDDHDLKSFFSSTKPNNKYLGKSLINIGTNLYNVYYLGVRIPTLFSNLLQCSESQLKLPDSLQNKAISFCFKQEDLANKRQGDSVLLNKILQELKLKLVISKEFQETLVLEVFDSSKLKETALSKVNSDRSKSSISDDFKVIAIDNSPIETLKDELIKIFKVQIQLKNSHLGRYNITLNNSNFKTLQESMNYYGLRIYKTRTNLPKYHFE